MILYGIVFELLFYGLGLHYILTTDASARSKAIVGGLLAAVTLFGRWMPVFLSLSIQFLLCAYILVVYRLQEPASKRSF